MCNFCCNFNKHPGVYLVFFPHLTRSVSATWARPPSYNSFQFHSAKLDSNLLQGKLRSTFVETSPAHITIAPPLSRAQPISGSLLRAPHWPKWRRPLALSTVCNAETLRLGLQDVKEAAGRSGGVIGMSRRRKYGDIPILKNTPYKAAAAEECNSVIEPGRRRPRSARRSGLRVAGEGPPGPGRPQEQRPAAASCSKSNPEGETWAARPPGRGFGAPQPSHWRRPGCGWGWSPASLPGLLSASTSPK
jgi:hypothetical protein